MKRFTWPLQRLLDVKIQQEQTLKTELFALVRDIATLRQEITQRRYTLRAQLADLAGQNLHARIAKQEVFMNFSAIQEEQIRALETRLTQAESYRQQKIAELLRTRSSRETLEKKRSEARALHMKKQLKLEQKHLDEGSHISFARNALESQRARSSTGSPT